MLGYLADPKKLEGVHDSVASALGRDPRPMIATPTGERPIDEIRPGDLVITRDSGPQEVRWTGRRILRYSDLRRASHLRPVLIRAGSLGHDLPARDLFVSPNQRILVATDRATLRFDEPEEMVAAKHLTGVRGVESFRAPSVTYHHLTFDRHEVVLVNGLWVESFQPRAVTMGRVCAGQRAEIGELFPDLAATGNVIDFEVARRASRRLGTRLFFGLF